MNELEMNHSYQLSASALKSINDYEKLLEVREEYYAHKQLRSQFDRDMENETSDQELMGKAAWIRGQHEQAVNFLSDKSDALLCLLAGESKFIQKDFKNALTYFEKARSGGLSSLQQLTRLTIETLAELGKLDEARQLLPSLTSGSSDHFYCQALIYDYEHRYEEALMQYEKTYEINSRDKYAFFRAAMIHDRYGNDEQAIILYEKCREVMPVILGCLVNLGILYEDAGRYQDSVYCFEEILDIDPTHERASLYINDVNHSFNMTYDEEAERLRDQQQKLLQTNIADFELSVRSRNCLQMMNIHTLGDLVQKSEQELLSYPNFGDTSLQEIKEILKTKKIRLGQSLKPGAFAKSLNPDGQDSGEDPILQTTIASLKFSIRSSKVLESLGVATVGDLVQFSEEQLLAQKNFGKTSIKEINSKLSAMNLQLKKNEKKEKGRRPSIHLTDPDAPFAKFNNMTFSQDSAASTDDFQSTTTIGTQTPEQPSQPIGEQEENNSEMTRQESQPEPTPTPPPTPIVTPESMPQAGIRKTPNASSFEGPNT